MQCNFIQLSTYYYDCSLELQPVTYIKTKSYISREQYIACAQQCVHCSQLKRKLRA